MKSVRKAPKYMGDWVGSNQMKIYHFKITKSLTQRNVTKCLEKIRTMRERKNAFVYAVSINAPYGSITQTKKLSDAFLQTSSDLEAPLYTFAEDFALECGYYLLSSGHKIYANPYSLIGNVSLRHQQLRFGNFLKKWGIKYETIADQTSQSRTNPLKEPSEEDKKWLREVLEEIYDEITTKILKSRQVIFERLQLKENDIKKDLLGGKIFTAEEALSNGLIDEISTFEEFKERYYKKHKLVEFNIDKDNSVGLRSLGNAVGNWVNVFKQKEESLELTAIGKPALADARFEFTEKLVKLLNTPEMVEKLEQMISNEVLDQYFDALAKRVSSDELRYLVQDAIRTDYSRNMSDFDEEEMKKFL
mmetsp:Transcript_56124/g.64400  ORF Transcript_56124/g.64400 Transcript_56124/m.64400 type:complete len:361 (+) Transcript_56124:29-1111(+)